MNLNNKYDLINRCIFKYDWDKTFSNKVFTEYIRFMKLKIVKNDGFFKTYAPSPVINMMWKQHLLQSISYFQFLSSEGLIGESIHYNVKEFSNKNKAVFDHYLRYKRTKEDLNITENSIIWPKVKYYIKFSNNKFVDIMEVEKSEIEFSFDFNIFLTKKYDISNQNLISYHNIKDKFKSFSTIKWSLLPIRKEKRKEKKRQRCNDMILLSVECIDGVCHDFILNKELTFLDLKKKIFDRKGTSVDLQCLYFSNNVCKDSDKVGILNQGDLIKVYMTVG